MPRQRFLWHNKYARGQFEQISKVVGVYKKFDSKPIVIIIISINRIVYVIIKKIPNGREQ